MTTARDPRGGPDRRRAPGSPALPAVRLEPAFRPGERVIRMFPSVGLDRRYPSEPPGLVGELYVTCERLLHASDRVVETPLEAIVDSTTFDARLLLITAGGRSLTILAPDPRAIRAVLAEARADWRALLLDSGAVAQSRP